MALTLAETRVRWTRATAYTDDIRARHSACTYSLSFIHSHTKQSESTPDHISWIRHPTSQITIYHPLQPSARHPCSSLKNKIETSNSVSRNTPSQTSIGSDIVNLDPRSIDSQIPT
eukprot:634218-Prymnesium_polylepis.1